MNTIKFRDIRLAAVSMLALSSAQAYAQSAPEMVDNQGVVPSEVDSEVEQDGSSSVIVVTARGRDESLFSVPVVVSVLDAEDLSRNRASDLSRIGELTPSVIVGSYKSQNGGALGIRGISTAANQSGLEQAVSVAIDGVQTSDGRIAQVGFFDLQQVEILKGPQALFFGRNSTAGVISINTANPTSEFYSSVTADYEFVGDEVIVDGVVSGPLGDNLGARLAVRYRNLDGWRRNIAGPTANPFYNPATGAPAGAAQLPGARDRRPGDEEFLGRLTLRSELFPSLTARLKLGVAVNSGPGPGVATQNIGPCVGPNPRMNGVPDTSAECEIDNRTAIGNLPPAISRTFANGTDDGSFFDELEVYTAALEFDWDIGNSLNLVSITGFSDVDYEYFSGLDQTSFSQHALYSRQTNRDISQQLRLSSEFEGAFNFMLGAYYADNEQFVTDDLKISDSMYVAAADRFTIFEDVVYQDGNSVSVFGQAIVDVTDTLELAGGVRWSHEEKDYRRTHVYGLSIFNIANTSFPGSNELGFLEGSYSEDNISPEVTLTWRPNADRTVFVAYRTGFKAGGFGLTAPVTTSSIISDVSFESETAEGFEVGARGAFLDGRLRLSSAAFSYEFSDLQVATYDAARAASFINNAGSVRQRGFELEGDFDVTPELTVRAALAYVHARFDDFTGQCYSYAFPAGATRATAVPPPNCIFADSTTMNLVQVFDGRAPARSPDWTGNVGFAYERPVGDFIFNVTGGIFYSGSYFASEAMSPASLQDSFFRFNAGIGIRTSDDRWNLQLIGRNLSNEYYLLYAADRTGGTGVPGVPGEQRGVVARGREVALSIQHTF